ncbi:MAG: hypothetical protein QNK37_15110 [Acidobacteriota bacterium]|nr:hypothetical protein [Acidobacteriota bacterium]
MSTPRYIQIIRLLSPGERISFREAALIGNQHFDWYKNYKSPVKEMEKMIRSGLKKYESIVIEINGKQFIDTSKALTFAESKYPKSYYSNDVIEPSLPLEVSKGKPTRLICVCAIFFTSMLLSLILLVPKKTGLELSESLYHSGDIEGLLQLNRETMEEIPIDQEVNEEFHSICDDLDLPLNFSLRKTFRPLNDDVAFKVASLNPRLVPVNENNIIAAFPYLDEPLWLFEGENGDYLPVLLGSKVELDDGFIGVVTNVGQLQLTIKKDSGTVRQFQRPILILLNIKPTGRSSIIYPKPEGNWNGLLKYFEIDTNEGLGCIAGSFPPWTNLNSLKALLKGNDIRFSLGYYGSTIDYRGSLSDLISNIMAYYPYQYQSFLDEESVWYRGEDVPDLFATLGLVIEKKAGTLVIWQETEGR